MSPVFTRNALAGDPPLSDGTPQDQQMANYDEYLRNLHMRDQQMPSSGVIAPDTSAIDPYQMQDFNNRLLGQEGMQTRRAY